MNEEKSRNEEVPKTLSRDAKPLHLPRNFKRELAGTVGLGLGLILLVFALGYSINPKDKNQQKLDSKPENEGMGMGMGNVITILLCLWITRYVYQTAQDYNRRDRTKETGKKLLGLCRDQQLAVEVLHKKLARMAKISYSLAALTSITHRLTAQDTQIKQSAEYFQKILSQDQDALTERFSEFKSDVLATGENIKGIVTEINTLEKNLAERMKLKERIDTLVKSLKNLKFAIKNNYTISKEKDFSLNLAKYNKQLESLTKNYREWSELNSWRSPSQKLSDNDGDRGINSCEKLIDEITKQLKSQLSSQLDAKLTAQQKISDLNQKKTNNLEDVGRDLLETAGYKLPKSDTPYGRLFKLIDSQQTPKERLSLASKWFVTLSSCCTMLDNSLEKLTAESFLKQEKEIAAQIHEIHEAISGANNFLKESAEPAKKVSNPHYARTFDDEKKRTENTASRSTSQASQSSSSSLTSSVSSSFMATNKHRRIDESLPSMSSSQNKNRLWDEKRPEAKTRNTVPNLSETNGAGEWLEKLLTKSAMKLNPVQRYYACLAALFFLAESTRQWFSNCEQLRRLRHNLAGNLGVLLIKPVAFENLLDAVKEFTQMIAAADKEPNQGAIPFQTPANATLKLLMSHDPDDNFSGLPFSQQLHQLNAEGQSSDPHTRALIELVNSFRKSQKQFLVLLKAKEDVEPATYNFVVEDAKKYRHDKAFHFLNELHGIWERAVWDATSEETTHSNSETALLSS